MGAKNSVPNGRTKTYTIAAAPGIQAAAGTNTSAVGTALTAGQVQPARNLAVAVAPNPSAVRTTAPSRSSQTFTPLPAAHPLPRRPPPPVPQPRPMTTQPTSSQQPIIALPRTTEDERSVDNSGYPSPTSSAGSAAPAEEGGRGVYNAAGGMLDALQALSLASHFNFLADLKCTVCHKLIPSDNIELHLLQCLTKPQIVYNEDVLLVDRGECSICFDELQKGHTIARLPCLCIYHKGCIDGWFAVSRCCPEHPEN